MHNKEKIRIAQFTILVFLYTIGTAILMEPNIGAIFAKNDGWIPILLNIFIGLLAVLFYLKIAQSIKNQDFFQYMDNTIGSLAGKIFSVVFFLYCFILAAVLLREAGDFATIQLYPDTPIDIIIALFVTIMAFGARYGIETLCRSAELMFPWFILLLLILLFALIPKMKIIHIAPVFEHGLKPIISASYASIGTPYFQLFLFLLLIPFVDDQEKVKKSFLLGSFLGGIVIALVTLATFLVLGSEATSRLFFPSYTTAKAINIAHIIERIEAFLSAIWFISIYIKITLTFYFSILFLKHLFNLEKTDFLVYPLGLVILFLSLFISPNISHYRTFLTNTWTPYSATVGILLPLILLLVHGIKNRKKSREQHGKTI